LSLTIRSGDATPPEKRGYLDSYLRNREANRGDRKAFLPVSRFVFSQSGTLPVRVKYPSVEPRDEAMPKVEITVPEHLEMQIAQLVEQGEFLNREEAIEDLLSTGLKAYKTSGPVDEEEEPGFEDDGMMGHDDEYVF
jgi:hypothetical protein